MAQVRAKFRVDSIARQASSKYENGAVIPVEIQTIRLTPVTGGSPENKQFFAYTPGGSIELGCANADAAKAFDIGKEFYVDFTEAVPPPPEAAPEAVAATS